jgi:hypothetical protein
MYWENKMAVRMILKIVCSQPGKVIDSPLGAGAYRRCVPSNLKLTARAIFRVRLQAFEPTSSTRSIIETAPFLPTMCERRYNEYSDTQSENLEFIEGYGGSEEISKAVHYNNIKCV